MTRILSLQAFEKSNPTKSVNQGKKPVHAHHASAAAQQQQTCILCPEKHYITKCPTYQRATEARRVEIIAEHKLCYNCLGHHRAALCKSTKRCIRCGRKHHTTIHEVSSITKDKENTSKQPLQAHCATSRKTTPNSITLLATAQVIVCSDSGYNLTARALVDPGSQISFISARLVQQLHLPKKSSYIPLIGIGATKVGKTQGLVSCSLRSKSNSIKVCHFSAHVLPKLTASIPIIGTDYQQWPHLKELTLADPTQSPGPIDIIIGADYYGQILEDGLKQGPANTPTAQNTIFGWILFGPCGNPNIEPTAHQSFHTTIDQELYDLIHRFWLLDEIPQVNQLLSPDEQACEDHYKSTVQRDPNGRYIVRLPFQSPANSLGRSKDAANRMLNRITKKMETEPSYKEAYTKFLTEYESLGHMQAIPTVDPEPEPVYYLPHHGILRGSSLATKFRVVFNASNKTTSGVSLNDLLHTGAKLQRDLFEVLIWFRLFQYVFTSDIEKMYRQIKIHPDDWNFQRILWLDHQYRIIQYHLTTVTYGISAAPFLALRTILQLIRDEGSKYPKAVPVLLSGRYVDDVLGGADTIEEAKETAKQVNELCMAGGFPLQKWLSNHKEVLQSIDSSKHLFSTTVSLNPESDIHILGMSWNSVTDTFHFPVFKPAEKVFTKRSILSTIAHLFDPTGLLSPIMITAKLIMQKLWTIKIGWDDQLPSSIANEWLIFINSMTEIESLVFPRWIGYAKNQSIQIHGFSDASQHALAAAVYIKTTDSNGQSRTALLSSKTKVAPLKRLTIPRLELSAAVLLVKLITNLMRTLVSSDVQIHLWTDSSIVYTWINAHPSKWKEFVRNRVCFIQEAIPAARWRFISGKENPADCATRGLTPQQLLSHPEWWYGPKWLIEPEDQWPSLNLSSVKAADQEIRSVQVATGIMRQPNNYLLTRFSSFIKLIRKTVICKRVASYWRQRINRFTLYSPISPEELETEKIYWIKLVQQESFSKEYQLLLKKQSLPSSNSLAKLTPFIDSKGLLRLGGRLQNSTLPMDAKHPLIVPKDSPLAKIIIADAHQKTLHGGVQDTLTYTRNHFWILSGRSLVKSIVLKCARCARYRQKRACQLMGRLPIDKVTPARPFLHSGVDYAGPLIIQTWRGKSARKYKAYIALFVCLSTSAIHIELVTNYAASGFLAAYKRFTARRGICATLRSDCGTNFIGANSELKAMFSESSKELQQIAHLISNDGTKWIFNPPSAPHFGGNWEAGVKSVKSHLLRTIGENHLTYEEMTTLLTQIEAVLNSRPIGPISDDPDDLSVLTPSHFLIGGPSTVIPEASLENRKISKLNRWHLIRQITESFWNKWMEQCLQRYQVIHKWKTPSNDIHEGSIVLIADERYPPGKWPLGRVLTTHQGADNLIRVAVIRTQTSTITRPITKLCPLPTDQDSL
ncbi:uncharacterized protein LOC123272906 [Cotesia glomerata]|uniref:uncharacterized protein LOC123272906 n=1 Tax=Cotesia glomerata TaxID=32391 RepID=UPI001D00D0E9|nr:uncharacterized protein LOC123272906 [Cotesia glomerata]